MSYIKESPQDHVFQEDIENIIKYEKSVESLKGSTVMITGATGLIGTMFVKTLLCANRMKGTQIRVLALVRNPEKASRIFGHLIDDDFLTIITGDVLSLPEITYEIDYIIHGASITASKDFVDRPVDTIMTALIGTKNMLRLAKDKNVKQFLYISSLEVYGSDLPDKPISEHDYGVIDPLSVRSSYSEGKRMAENLCVSYNKQFGVPVCIARLSQTFGAGVDYNDGRVFAMFARSVIEHKDIVLRTDGSTLRNYCYISDVISALLTILKHGENGQAYNVANSDTDISIRDLAQFICDRYPEAGIKVVFDVVEDVTKLGFNPKVVIRLDSSLLENLGWKPRVGLGSMFDRLIDSMRLQA